MVSARRTRPRSGATLCRFQHTAAREGSGLGTLPEDVAAARFLIAAGCPAEAVRLLAAHLVGLDYCWLPADALLIDACVLYATHTTGRAQLDAARYAHRASHQLHDQPTHPCRLAAARAYGAAPHAHGEYDEAIVVHRQLLASYRTLYRPLDILTITVSLALNLHAAGRCVEALQAIADAWPLWQYADLDSPGLGRAIAAAHVRMLRACRRDHDLLALLHRHLHTETGDILTTTVAEVEDDHSYGHHGAVCSHTPQTPTRTPWHWHAEPQHLAGEPVSLLDDPARYGGTAHRDVHRELLLCGYPATDVTAALSRALVTPQAQAVLRHDLGHPAGTGTRRWMTVMLLGHAAYRRVLHACRAWPYTCSVVLPIIVAVLTLASALIWRN